MEWMARLVDQVSPGAASATAGIKAFRAELAAASADLKAFQAAGGQLGAGVAAGSTQAAAGAGAAAQAATGASTAAAGAASSAAAAGQAIRPAWAAGQAEARAASGAFQASGKAAAGAAGAAGKAAAGAGTAAAAAGSKGASALSSISGASSSAASALGGLRGASTMLLGALGLAGAMSVTKLALGARGMAQLDAITARTQVSVRQLFARVDPSPIVRAYNRFSQLFSSSTVTGKALGDIFTRSFNALFSAVEKAEPYVTAFVQGAVLGFLYLEYGILRARIALFPYTSALDGVVSSTSLLRVAAIGGGLALAVAAGYAVVAAAPFLALAAAIASVAAAFEQASKLAKEWDENSSSQIWRKLKKDLGLGGSQRDQERAQGIVQGEDYDRMQAERAKAAAATAKPAATAPAAAAGASAQAAAAKGADPKAAQAAGQATGAAMAAGMVAGMQAGQGAVAQAGADLAAAADKGVRDKAEIRSPSRLFHREAEHMGQGAAQGLRASAGDVQRAADEALVPRPPAATATASRGPTQIVHIGRIEAPNVFDPGGLAGFVRSVVRGTSTEALESMGVPST